MPEQRAIDHYATAMRLLAPGLHLDSFTIGAIKAVAARENGLLVALEEIRAILAALETVKAERDEQ